MYRFTHVLKTFVFLYFSCWGRTKKEKALKICEALDELGGVFVKSGQFFANRPDLFSGEYRKEFARLFENTTPEPWEAIREVSRRQYGVCAEDYFDEFDTKVYRSASLAQTYRARHKGEDLIVKIKKPHIDDQINKDLRVAYCIAWLIDLIKGGRLQAKGIVLELEQWTLAELDYRQEATNHLECAKRHKRLLFSKVYIPRVFPEYSGVDVLVTEYVEGLSLDEFISQAGDSTLAHEARKSIVTTVVSYLVEAAHVDGLFHADPHPSNILVSFDGSICFIDFGIVGILNPNERTKILQHVRNLMHGDIMKSFDSLLDVCGTSRSLIPSDVWERYQVITTIFQKSVTMEEYFAYQESEGPVFYRIIHLFQGSGIEMPVDMLRYFKTFQTMEGVIHRLDADMEISTLVQYWNKVSYQNIHLLMKRCLIKDKLSGGVNNFINTWENMLL